MRRLDEEVLSSKPRYGRPAPIPVSSRGMRETRFEREGMKTALVVAIAFGMIMLAVWMTGANNGF